MEGKLLFRLSLGACFIFISFSSLAQTKGIIFDPATGAGSTLLDPNGDGFVSADANGFISDDEAESEISYIAIPTAGTEGDGDVSHGASCSYVDFVNTVDTSPLYFYSDGTYLFFRFRIGGSSNSSKTYSVFIDTDQKYGFSGNDADPNAVTGNPGFEIELSLHTNRGIGIYDVDGNVNPSANEVGDHSADRPSSVHSQRSVALTEVCDDDDYFYDFYVAFADFGVLMDENTKMRMVAQSGISANPIIGTTSGTDLGGVDDDSGDGFDLIDDMIDDFPPTSGTDLSGGGPILHRAACPGINSPIEVGATSVSGTSTEADGATITVYVDGGSPETTNVSGGTWTASGFTAFAGGEVITATAEISGVKSTSYDNCNPVTVDQTCSDTPIISGEVAGGTGKGLYGISTEEGAIVSVWTDSGLSNLWSGAGATHTNPGEVGTGGSTATSSEWQVSGGANDLSDGVYYVTVENSPSECKSEPAIYCNGITNSLAPTISTTHILTTSTSIDGTSTGDAEIELFIDGISSGLNTTASAGGVWSIAVSDLAFGSSITVKATDVGLCPTESAAKTVTRYSVAPLILDEFCAAGGVVTEIYGISSEPFGSTVTLYTRNSLPVITGSPVATGTVDANGNWMISGINLLAGTYAAVTNIDDTNADPTFHELESELSNTIQILTQTTDANLEITTLEIFEGDAEISGEGTNGNTIQLYIDDVAIEGFTTTVAGGVWTIGGLDEASEGYDVLYPGGQVGVTSASAGQCESDLVEAIDVIQCKSYLASAIALNSSASVCVNETVSLTFDNSEESVYYQLYTDAAATSPTGAEMEGDGGTLILTSDPLSTDITKLYLKAKRIGVDCDKVFSTSFTIAVKGTPSITLDASNFVICDDVSTGSITYSDVTNGPLLTYNIDFGTAAEAQGFTDISDASIAAQLNFAVPGSAADGSYSGAVTVENTASGTCVSSAYNFTVEIVEDVIAYGIKTDPTCLNNDGDLLLAGLKASTTYQLDYDLDGTAVSSSASSDASGHFLLDGIGSGDYSNFNVTRSGCTSNTLTTTQTLTAPTQPTATITSTNITEGDATISGTGTNGTTIDLYLDDVQQTGFSAVVAGGVWSISGLDAASAGSDILYPGGEVSIHAYWEPACVHTEVVASEPVACLAYAQNTITLTTGTDYCVNETATITFADSELSVDYQLFTDMAGTTSTGSVVAGTGAEITLVSDPLSTDITHLYLRASRDAVPCDKIFSTSFTIDVNGVPSIVLTDNSFEVCPDQNSFNLSYSDVVNGPLTSYDIDFNAAAEAQGFVDVNKATIASELSFDIPNGTAVGNYAATIRVANSTSSSCVSPNYDFSFKVIEDEISYGNIASPSACNALDGSIELLGLTPETFYVLHYIQDGTDKQVPSVEADVNGAFLFSNLEQGTYRNFYVVATQCASNTLTTPVALEDPATAQIKLLSSTGPTNCLNDDGFIVVEGLEADETYAVHYEKSLEPLSQSLQADTNGQLQIGDLNNGIYSNFEVERLNCRSNLLEETITFVCSQELYNTPVVTPNGDGFNDYMEIEGIESYPNNKVSIFNRWGNLIWEKDRYRNDDTGFGGEGNSSMANGTLTDGTYFLIIDKGDGSQRQKNYVVIKR